MPSCSSFSIKSQELVSYFRSIWNSRRVEFIDMNSFIFQLLSFGKPSSIGCGCYRLSRRYIHGFRSSSVDPVLHSPSLDHPFKNWQDQRKNKLTASIFGGAIGLWRHRRVQLWLEKLGAIEPFEVNFATRVNNVKFKEALERYIYVTDNSVLLPNSLQIHDKDDWLAASPDGVIDVESRGVLEIKIPCGDGDFSTVSPWRHIPVYYMPQAQGLLEIMDMDWMDFYVWTPKRGSNLFRVYRDVEYWALLKAALSDFWWNHVDPAKKICDEYDVMDPLVQLSLLQPEPRHELCDSIVYQSKALVYNSKLLKHYPASWKKHGAMNFVSD